MTDTKKFSGVIAPVVTPFGEDGTPDADRFLEHCEWLMADGCTALAPFGTTSEGNSIGIDEKMELLEELVDADIDPAVLMPGTGSCSVADAIIMTEHALELGCGGMLMLPPFYYKNPSEEGLFRFFAEVIEEVGDDALKIYLYHIPPVAQVGFSLPLIARLRKEFPDTVVGLKDSSGDWANTKAILDANPGFEVFPGSEVFLLDGLRNGAAGCISATANVAARSIRNLYDHWQGSDADKLQSEVTALRKAIQSYPMIPFVKALVAHYRDDPAWADLRPPFTEMPEDEVAAGIEALVRDFDFRMHFGEDA
ncbi:MAG: dihydrodipicolinate synthase family protein [Hyphomicrobiaceae bacterium]